MIDCFNCCFSTKRVKANGIEYKFDIGVVLNIEDDLPQVGCVHDIYIVSGSQIAVRVRTFAATYYEPHYQPYLLDEEEDIGKLVYINNLFLLTPVHIRTLHVLGTNIILFCHIHYVHYKAKGTCNSTFRV